MSGPVFPYGETLTRRRWTAWEAGSPVGAPDVAPLAGVALAPVTDASDPASRRGHVIPRHDLYGPYALDVQAHDLVEREDGTVLEVSTTVARWKHPRTGSERGCHATLTELAVNGPETIVVFPTVEDSAGRYGDTVRRPADQGVTVTGVTLEPQPSPEGTQGQDTAGVWRLVGTGLEELDEFSVVEWPPGSGQVFDVVGVPVRWPWPQAHAYTQVTIRERR